MKDFEYAIGLNYIFELEELKNFFNTIKRDYEINLLFNKALREDLNKIEIDYNSFFA